MVSLEALPTEIKVKVMSSMSSVKTIHNITHASPQYYQAYHGAQEKILYNIAVGALYQSNASILDAWTAVNAPQLRFGTPHRKEMITEYVKRYGDGLTDGHLRMKVKESLDVLSLHHKMKVLIEAYCNEKLGRNPFTGVPEGFSQPSSSELRRLFRAFYRFEIYCRVFGGYKLDDRRCKPRISDFNKVEAAELFFGLFSADEVEEIACVRKHAEKFYDEMRVRRSSPLHEAWIDQGPSVMYVSFTASSLPQNRMAYFQVRQNESNPQWVPDVSIKKALSAHERSLGIGAWPFRTIDAPADWIGACNVDCNDVCQGHVKMRKGSDIFWDEPRLADWRINGETMLGWHGEHPDRRA